MAMMLGTNDAMAVDLPRAPKAFSKAARSPRQSSTVTTPRTARRPATGAAPRAPVSGSLSARSASAGPARAGGAALRLGVKDLPRVSAEEAAAVEGGALVAAAVAEHRQQYLRDGDNFRDDAAASADKRATAPPRLRENDGGAFGLGTREDYGDRFRGLTSSPRLPDTALLDGVVRDRLDAKCKAFIASVAIHSPSAPPTATALDSPNNGGGSDGDVPTAGQSPTAGASQREATMAERCAAVREMWVDARRTAAEVADVYVDGERDGTSPSSGGDAPSAPVVLTATQRAYIEVTQGRAALAAASPRSGRSPLSPVSTAGSEGSGGSYDSGDASSPLQIPGLTFEQAAGLQAQARTLLQEKRRVRDDVVPSARVAPINRESASFASSALRFKEDVSRNPPVGQYNPRTNGVDRHVRTAVICRKPKAGPGSPTSGSPQQSPRATAAPPKAPPAPAGADGLGKSVSEPPSHPASAGVSKPRPLDTRNPPLAAAARGPEESPRARAKQAAAEQPQKPPAPSWPFASKSKPPPPRQSACRDHVRAMPNEAALSTVSSPRAHVQFARAVGREAMVPSHVAHGPSSAPSSVPNPPPGLADQCAAPAPTRARGTGNDFRSHRNDVVPSRDEDRRSSPARTNADVAIARAGAVAVHGHGAAGFVDFGRQTDRARPSGSKVLNAAAAAPTGDRDTATSIDMIDVVALTRPRPAGLVEFGKQKSRPPLHEVMTYHTTEHSGVPEPPSARHLRDIDFGKMGPHELKPAKSDCAAECYDVELEATTHRTRAATIGRPTAPAHRPVPAERTDYQFAKVYGEISRRSKKAPASGAAPTTTYSKHTYPTSEGADLTRGLNGTRRRRVDRAPDLHKQLGHAVPRVHLTETSAMDPDNVDPPVVHDRVRGDPMLAKHVDRNTRNKRLEPPPVVPLSMEAATVLLGVRKAAALQAERADVTRVSAVNHKGEPLRSPRTRADFHHTTSRETRPHDRLAVRVMKRDEVPGPGSYEV
uniref:Uncharacterized protein n=1 Tax=Neobodo designis TaxID=312471 RepID=A0A6U4TI92_NEODS|mmetsp:Transcript_36729/g.113235  ORF Transcript_36729/g.113235 Transcript_36729/m.113235 type:complete len:995 (+) Transcript_36729:118-3102(+)|eukprot:CAMPEP_0174833320 /NCGR_PEP_ID=MMETSP1114-20130205/4164_1 /TAXON_ID=312471 /ORGANISM="Neobodo designis, Strain CCAP 1951/1" /LENGTH=994 /DNA_ID=CAMNT_0016067199 /DNA_START=118 /DNA_END=3102 /DNA_ORIENTATION=-